MAKAKSRARGFFSRPQLLFQQPDSQHRIGDAWMKVLDVVRFAPHSATRVHSPSSGVIGIGTSRYLGTASTDYSRERLQQSKGDKKTHIGTEIGGANDVEVSEKDLVTSYHRSQPDKGDKNIHLWTEKKPGASEFNQKMTRKALWVGSWSSPAWVKARFKMITQGRLQSRASCGTRDWSQGTAQANRVHTHSANTTSEAIATLKNRLRQGITTGSYMYVKVLQMCLKQKDLLVAKQVHGCMIESGMDKNQYAANALLNVYIRCGRLLDARRVFDELEAKDVVTWTIMIAGFAKNDHAQFALELFNRMRQEGVKPDAVTYLSILEACASPLALEWGKEVHASIRHAGLESDVRVGSALLQMYAKCGSIAEARRFFETLTNRDSITWNVMILAYAGSGRMDDALLMFDRMDKRDLFTWNIMIGAYAERGRGVEAYRLFLQMRREGFEPDAFTYASILNASPSVFSLEWVKEVHRQAREAGKLDLRVGNALVHMYAKGGSIHDARLVFDRMEKRDLVTWNSMVGGLAQHGCGHEALDLFRKMIAGRLKPDGTTFAAVLSACCHGGLLGDGRRLFSAMTQDYGIQPTVVHYTCMVDLLGRAGHLEEAKLLISDMPVEPDGVTWSALLGACRTHGNVELGELAAKELSKLEPENSSAYVLLSNIYAAAGKWEEVSSVRTVMRERGVRKERGRSWIEVDNKIHEFVVGDTSHPEAKAIYAELNKLTEQMKAEGYIPDTQLVLQKIAEEDKELVLCSHSEKLAIVYGLMCIPRGKPIRVYKNLRVCPDCHTATKIISKVTRREIIARDVTRFHHFNDGACSCGDYW
ncbi:unnamed protein product [Calypogeia fissa]